MTRPESSSTPDRPFLGAHSQVLGAHSVPTRSAEPSRGDRRTIPLEAVPTSTGHGWAIRLSVRAEQVTVEKQVVVSEEVVISGRQVGDVARLEAEVRREELRTSTEGEIEVADIRGDPVR